jgi:hypothetical protein
VAAVFANFGEISRAASHGCMNCQLIRDGLLRFDLGNLLKEELEEGHITRLNESLGIG